jgi:hypothetical protein
MEEIRFNVEPERRESIWKVKSNCIVLKKPWYEIPLQQANHPALAANWIAQVCSKTWADDHILADLVRVMDERGLLR